ncbi:MAG: hypothetical protein ACLUOF_01675 [Ruminococcus sp.]
MANKKKPSEKQAFLAEQRKAKRKESEKAKRKKHRTKKTVTAIVCCAAAAAVVAGGTTWFVREKPMTQLLSAGKTAHYKLNAAEVSFYAWQIYNGYITSNSESGSSNVPDTSKSLSDQNYDNDTTWEAYFTDAAESMLRTFWRSARRRMRKITRRRKISLLWWRLRKNRLISAPCQIR